MTWLFPPEILLRTFGTETGDIEADGDIDLQLRQAMLARPIFRGISPALEELNPLLGQRIRNSVAEFKQTIRPIMVNSRVFHHTPLLPLMEPSPWVVLEYAAQDSHRAVAGLFRTSQSGDPVYKFFPRGLDLSRSYEVKFGNSGQTIEVSGESLLQEGIPVRLDADLTSEMLIFTAR
jgi:alpha-galactosidase